MTINNIFVFCQLEIPHDCILWQVIPLTERTQNQAACGMTVVLIPK